MAACGLTITAPILACAAVLTKLTSPGPILFRQKRVGQHCRHFTLFKFRTMTVAADGPLITASNDDRITPVGRILRKTKIDELPGLWNVLRGDMSFVGPRPEVPEYVDTQDPQWQEILEARPGITDPVTLRLRSEETLLADVDDKERFYSDILQPYKLRGYIDFVRAKSLRTDLRIIGRTLKAVVFPGSSSPLTLEEIGWNCSPTKDVRRSA
jgi:lipopolysaccharide/colanic/teichoic acid biosynthesis glycosyltransferase